MYFEKYHGTGNDFILFLDDVKNPRELAKKVCDRHFGIGADGILYPTKSSVADIKMNYYNSDGSIAAMCGNGLRCFAEFVKTHKLVDSDTFKVETKHKVIDVSIHDGVVTFNLGKANLTPLTNKPIHSLNPYLFDVGHQKIEGYVIETLTMHTVIFTDQHELLSLAPTIQKNELFVNQSNINFVKVYDDHLFVKTFERGAGWTLSCGTGVCASAYLSFKLGKTRNHIHVLVPGGSLVIDIIDDDIYLTGPATYICKGEFNENI